MIIGRSFAFPVGELEKSNKKSKAPTVLGKQLGMESEALSQKRLGFWSVVDANHETKRKLNTRKKNQPVGFTKYTGKHNFQIKTSNKIETTLINKSNLLGSGLFFATSHVVSQ
jgi:hypothetical protein